MRPDAGDQGPCQPTISDAIRILAWLFGGGAAPPAPAPSAGEHLAGDCGTDLSPDDGMGCVSGSQICQ